MEEAAGGTGEVNRHGYTQRTMEQIERKETGVLQLGKRGLGDMSTNSVSKWSWGRQDRSSFLEC